MHYFGSGSALVAASDLGVGDHAEGQLLEPGIGDGFCVAAQLREHFFDVGGGVRQIVGEVDLFGLGEAQLDERELRLVAVDLDARLHFYEVVAMNVLGGGFELVPHASFDGAAAVTELKAKIRAALARVAQFFFVNKEKTSDVLVCEEI